MATSLELAITAIRSGRKEEGRQLLNLLIQQNPNNEMAWLWMSSVVNTDEQRARCLYHVLAINPDNELARRGLQLLGIVVSDSRPVKVPRDSQPIPVQRPEAEAATPWPVPPAVHPLKTQPLVQVQPPAARAESAPPAPAPNQTGPLAERRPFRLDPKTITQELPFTPIREPFAEPARRSPSAFITRPETDQPAAQDAPPLPQPAPIETYQPQQNGWPVQPSEPAPVLYPGAGMTLIPTTPAGVPLPDFPAAPSPAPNPADPNSTVTETGPLANNAMPAQGQAQYPAVPPQQGLAAGVSANETRPSQPIWVTHSNVTMSMPSPGPQNQSPYPAPGVNSNVTMGMPTPYFQPQNPVQVGPPIHSNATMGMPLPPQNSQLPHPSEPVPVIHPNGTMGLAYLPAQFQPAFPQNQLYHSSSTMAMPTMTEAEARARLLASQPMPGIPDPYAALRLAANPPDPGVTGVRASKKSSKKAGKEEDEEEVNLLAVIVFGSLSVTALGGMGMLILLWFTSVP